MTQSPELLGLAIAVFSVALAVLASTILWRHQVVRLRRGVAGLLVVVAVLLFGYAPGGNINRPAPLSASALVYILVPSSQGVAPGNPIQGNSVSAHSARTGATVWQSALPDSSGRDLLLLQNTLYVETFSDSEAIGHICALRGSDGARIWQYTIVAPLTADPYVLDSHAGVLYIPSINQRSGEIDITALRAADGRQLWQWTGRNLVFQQTPVVTANALYFLASSTHQGTLVTAIGATTGKLLWQKPVELPLGGTRPAVIADSGAVYTPMVGSGTNTAISALRASDGSLLWTTGSGTVNPVFIGSASGIVYIQLGFGVSALRARDGRQLWRFGSAGDPNSAAARYIHSVALSGDTIYISAQGTGDATNALRQLTNPETVYALDAASGAQRWRYATASGNGGTLDIQPTVVFMYADDGLAALDPSSGRLLWHSDAYSNAPLTWWPSSDMTPTTFLSSTRMICRLFACKYLRFQQYLSAVDGQDGVHYWTVPIGPPQQIYEHFTI
jgi:outer membrane protein assembly factor BamB